MSPSYSVGFHSIMFHLDYFLNCGSCMLLWRTSILHLPQWFRMSLVLKLCFQNRIILPFDFQVIFQLMHLPCISMLGWLEIYNCSNENLTILPGEGIEHLAVDILLRRLCFETFFIVAIFLSSTVCACVCVFLLIQCSRCKSSGSSSCVKYGTLSPCNPISWKLIKYYI